MINKIQTQAYHRNTPFQFLLLGTGPSGPFIFIQMKGGFKE